VALGLAGCLVGPAAAGAPAGPWPAFLPPRQAYPEEIAAVVAQTWQEATFVRTVRGRAVPVPLGLYAALVDTPDLTAAAARFRGLATDEVRLVGEDLYEAEDHRGARGYYRVLERDRSRRVLLSWGEHRSRWLGTVTGSALTVLTLEERGGAVQAELTAHVRIDNPVAAAVARVLLVPFGALVDRRLNEGCEIAARVAEWAMADPDGFHDWLARVPAPPERRGRIRDRLPLPPQRAGGPPAEARARGARPGAVIA
jgi:hypothetical protein